MAWQRYGQNLLAAYSCLAVWLSGRLVKARRGQASRVANVAVARASKHKDIKKGAYADGNLPISEGSFPGVRARRDVDGAKVTGSKVRGRAFASGGGMSQAEARAANAVQNPQPSRLRD